MDTADGMVLNLNAGGDIAMEELTGDILVGQIISTGGDVSLIADGGFLAADANSVIQGRRVSLEARNGGIGTTTLPIIVDTDGSTRGGLSAIAPQDIYVREKAGDLQLIAACSASGDVVIQAAGSIHDNNSERLRDNRTEEELLRVWDSLNLTGDAAQAASARNLASFQAQQERQYESYWQYRNVRQDDVKDSYNFDPAADVDYAQNTIRFASAHGLATGQRLDYDAGNDVAIGGLISGASYYVVVVDAATIQLAASRHHATAETATVIPLTETNTTSDSHALVTYNYAADAYNADFQFQYSEDEHQRLQDELGLSDTAVDELEAQKTAEYHSLHALFDARDEASQYNPDYVYQLSPSETDGLTNGAVWAVEELKYRVGKGLFSETSGTKVDIETPNVIGNDVTLFAGGAIGTDLEPVTIDLSGGIVGLSDEQRILLAAAERDDVEIDGNIITLTLRDDVDFEATGSLLVSATQQVFLGSELDINLEHVETNGRIRLKGKQGVYDVAMPAADDNIVGSGLVLEAAGATIGTSDMPIRLDLSYANNSVLTARAAQNIYLTETAGDMRLGTVFSPNHVHIVADGGIFDGRNDDDRNIKADTLRLQAGGAIGGSGNLLDVELDGTDGWLVATAGTDVCLGSVGTLNIDQITAAGTAKVSATGSIVDYRNDDTSNIDAAKVSVTAAGGDVGTEANPFEIDSSRFTSGVVRARAGQNIYLIETSGDLNVQEAVADTGKVVLVPRDASGDLHDLTAVANASISAASLVSIIANNVTTGAGSRIESTDDGSLIDVDATLAMNVAGRVEAHGAGSHVDLDAGETLTLLDGGVVASGGVNSLVEIDAGDVVAINSGGAVLAEADGADAVLTSGHELLVAGSVTTSDRMLLTAGPALLDHSDYFAALANVDPNHYLIGNGTYSILLTGTLTTLGDDSELELSAPDPVIIRGNVNTRAAGSDLLVRSDDWVYHGGFITVQGRTRILGGFDSEMDTTGGADRNGNSVYVDAAWLIGGLDAGVGMAGVYSGAVSRINTLAAGISIEIAGAKDVEVYGTVIAGGKNTSPGKDTTAAVTTRGQGNVGYEPIGWTGNDSSLTVTAGEQVHVGMGLHASKTVQVTGGVPGADDNDQSVIIGTLGGLYSAGRASDDTGGQARVDAAADVEITGHVVAGADVKLVWDGEGNIVEREFQWSEQPSDVLMNIADQARIGGNRVSAWGPPVEIGGYVYANDRIEINGGADESGTGILVHPAGEIVTHGKDSSIQIDATHDADIQGVVLPGGEVQMQPDPMTGDMVPYLFGFGGDSTLAIHAGHQLRVSTKLQAGKRIDLVGGNDPLEQDPQDGSTNHSGKGLVLFGSAHLETWANDSEINLSAPGRLDILAPDGGGVVPMPAASATTTGSVVNIGAPDGPNEKLYIAGTVVGAEAINLYSGAASDGIDIELDTSGELVTYDGTITLNAAENCEVKGLISAGGQGSEIHVLAGGRIFVARNPETIDRAKVDAGKLVHFYGQSIHIDGTVSAPDLNSRVLLNAVRDVTVDGHVRSGGDIEINAGVSADLTKAQSAAGGFDVADLDVGTITIGGEGESVLDAAGEVILRQGNGLDDDTDGVRDSVENSAPHGGDGNRDGVPDSQQKHVASLRSLTNDRFVTFAVPEHVRLRQVTAANNPSSEDAPSGIQFPVGFFDFQVDGLPAGGSIVVTVELEAAAQANTYYVFGPTPDDPNPHWYPFVFDGRTGAVIFADGIELHFVDGLRGDSDLTANGVIVDPGAPSLTDHPWQNPVRPEDVSNDDSVTPLDALILVNELNVHGSQQLPLVPAGTGQLPPYLDVTGDNTISPLDVLEVIEYLNGRAALGEGEPTAPANAIPSGHPAPAGAGMNFASAALKEESFAANPEVLWSRKPIGSPHLPHRGGLRLRRHRTIARRHRVMELPPTCLACGGRRVPMCCSDPSERPLRTSFVVGTLRTSLRPDSMRPSRTSPPTLLPSGEIRNLP